MLVICYLIILLLFRYVKDRNTTLHPRYHPSISFIFSIYFNGVFVKCVFPLWLADLQVVSTVVRNMVMDPLASSYALTKRPLQHKKEAMRQVGTLGTLSVFSDKVSSNLDFFFTFHKTFLSIFVL